MLSSGASRSLSASSLCQRVTNILHRRLDKSWQSDGNSDQLLPRAWETTLTTNEANYLTIRLLYDSLPASLCCDFVCLSHRKTTCHAAKFLSSVRITWSCQSVRRFLSLHSISQSNCNDDKVSVEQSPVRVCGRVCVQER